MGAGEDSAALFQISKHRVSCRGQTLHHKTNLTNAKTYSETVAGALIGWNQDSTSSIAVASRRRRRRREQSVMVVVEVLQVEVVVDVVVEVVVVVE